MHTTPEFRDRVELMVPTVLRGMQYPAGLRGEVTYASYSGWFMVAWEDQELDLRHEQRELGTVMRIYRPRRGKRPKDHVGS